MQKKEPDIIEKYIDEQADASYDREEHPYNNHKDKEEKDYTIPLDKRISIKELLRLNIRLNKTGIYGERNPSR